MAAKRLALKIQQTESRKFNLTLLDSSFSKWETPCGRGRESRSDGGRARRTGCCRMEQYQNNNLGLKSFIIERGMIKKKSCWSKKNERKSGNREGKKHKSCELPPSVCAHGSGYNLAPKRHCNVTMLSSAQSLLIDSKVLLRWHSCARIGSVCVRWKRIGKIYIYI